MLLVEKLIYADSFNFLILHWHFLTQTSSQRIYTVCSSTSEYLPFSHFSFEDNFSIFFKYDIKRMTDLFIISFSTITRNIVNAIFYQFSSRGINFSNQVTNSCCAIENHFDVIISTDPMELLIYTSCIYYSCNSYSRCLWGSSFYCLQKQHKKSSYYV